MNYAFWKFSITAAQVKVHTLHPGWYFEWKTCLNTGKFSVSFDRNIFPITLTLAN